MGSSNSNGREAGRVQGSMFITLESNAVMPGGILRGAVHVSLAEGIVSSSLCLIFNGYEFTEFKARVERGEDSVLTRFSGFNSLCNLKLLLYQYQDTILPGNFSFPFQLKTYDGMLPSFDCPINLGVSGRISYALRAELYGSGKTPLAFELPIYVFTNSITLPPDMYPVYLEQKCSYHSKTCFCFKKESATARVWIERGIFSSSDAIDVHIEAKFSSLFSADSINVSFGVKKILTIIANEPSNRSHSESLREFNADINYKIEKGTENQLFNYRIPVQTILHNLSCGLCYSMGTNLIKCQYVLSVRLWTNENFGKCYNIGEATQLIVILPFQIQVPMLPPPIAPEQWQAQILVQAYPNAENQNLENPSTQIVVAEAASDQESDKFIR